MGGVVGTVLGLLAIVLPGLLLQDTLRYIAIADGKAHFAVILDATWLLIQLALIYVIMSVGMNSIAPLTIAWGASAGITAVVGLLALKIRPRRSGIRLWWSSHGRLARTYTFEFLTTIGSQQGITVGIGAVAGLSAVAGVRAAQVALGPVMVLQMAANLAVVRELVAVYGENPRIAFRKSLLVGCSLAVAAVVAGVAVSAVPAEYGSSVLGESWAAARPLIPYIALSLTAVGFGIGGALALRAGGFAERSLRVRLVLAPVYVLTTITFAVLYGGVGAAAGMGVSSSFGAVVWWTVASSAYRSLGDHRRG